MIPLGVTSKTALDERVMKFLGEMNSNFGHFLMALFEFRNDYYKKTYNKTGSLHDPCAVAYVINPEIFQSKEMFVGVETKSEFCYGRTVCDIYEKLKMKSNAIVGLDIDLEKFWTLVFESLKECNKNSTLN